MKINHNITETDIDNIDVKSPLEHQIQKQKMKDSGWRFDKIISVIIYFYQTGPLNSSKYVKIPLRSNSILHIEKMINIVPFGRYWLSYILVIIIILTEYQIIKNFLKS